MSSDSENSEFDDLAAAIKGVASDDEVGSDKEEESDHEIDSDEEESEQKEDKPKVIRKPNITENPELLDKVLFGDKKNFVRKLDAEQVLFYEDGHDDIEETAENAKVWHDSDDDNVEKDKELKSKRKFERITGSDPSWASLDKKKKHKTEDSDGDDDITRTVGHLSKKQVTDEALTKGSLLFKRLANINKMTNREGRITVVEFHPRSTVAIVAGLKGVVSLFAIDGKENKKIHNIKYESFPIHSCKLAGDDMILGTVNYPFYHSYNLLTGYKQRARLPKSVKDLKSFQLSPCGKYMAVSGDFGEIHLLHAPTKELFTTMKQENQCTGLTFSKDSRRLIAHSDNSEVTIFDIRTHRMEHRFVDDGCVNGTSLAISEDGSLVATGSRQGYVNVYNYESLLKSKLPKPLKTFGNLTTEITDLKFNPTNEILSFCSLDADNAIKHVHLRSMTVFDNFPSQQDMMGKITTMSYSPGSGYLGFGNIGGVAPLYRFKHYNNY